MGFSNAKRQNTHGHDGRVCARERERAGVYDVRSWIYTVWRLGYAITYTVTTICEQTFSQTVAKRQTLKGMMKCMTT